MNRRWFLKALVALPLVPLATKMAAATELAPSNSEWLIGWGAKHQQDWVSDIIATTIESRSQQIADNVNHNNVLLQALRAKGRLRA